MKWGTWLIGSSGLRLLLCACVSECSTCGCLSLANGRWMLLEMVVESKCYIINGLDDINGGQWFWGWILRPEKDSVNRKKHVWEMKRWIEIYSICMCCIWSGRAHLPRTSWMCEWHRANRQICWLALASSGRQASSQNDKVDILVQV